MKAKPVVNHKGEHYGHRFHCPGCDEEHVITTLPYPGGWTWNGSLERPTFTPSILVHELRRADGTIYSPRCHSYVKDGRIEYLNDSGHALKDQTVDLPELSDGA